jgi:twinkle protein
LSLAKQLKEQGIILVGKPIEGRHETDCPRDYCQIDRAGMDTDCLKVDILGKDFAEWKCANCLWSGKVGTDPRVEVEEPPVAPQVPALAANRPPQSADGLPMEIIQYFEDRKIALDVVQKCKIRWNEEQQAIGFPYLDTAGVPSNMMYLQIPEQTTRLASAKRIQFYGINEIDFNQDVIIVQTEMDRLALLTSGLSNVISLPNGGNLPRRVTDSYEQAPDEFEYFAQHAEAFVKMHRIIIAMDNTPEGDVFRHEIARRVGAAKCFNVKFSRRTLGKTFKDMGIDEICADIHEAKPHPIRGLYEVMDFESQLMTYFDGGMASGVSTGWENVDRLYTIVGGQLTTVTGIPNSGKSEWVDALTLNLALSYGWRFGVFSPENGKEVHVTKLVEKRVEITADPRSSSRMSRETFLSGASWVNEHYFFIVSDIMESMPTLEWILERAADAVLRYGIKGLIIDPWNRIDKKLGAQSETDYTAGALAQILRFAQNHDVHVWLVAHPAKQQADKKTGIIPPPSLYDIAGSAHFVNMTDNGIVIHRSASIDDSTEVWVKKVRFKHVGTTGDTLLMYNKETGRFTSDTPDAIYSMTTEEEKKRYKKPAKLIETIEA